MAQDFLAGCVGGCAGVLAGHPLDTLKVHVQTGRGGALQCARALVQGNALASLYRGVRAPLAGVAGINAVVFGVHGTLLRRATEPPTLGAHAAAGFAAGLVQSLVCTPVELVKTRQQLGETGARGGMVRCARDVLRQGGARALFRGLSVTAVRDAPGFAVYFASFEAMAGGEDASPARVFAAGGTAGILSWVAVYPADVVKSRIQADGAGGPRRYAGAVDCMVRSVRAEGWTCMTRGLGTMLLRAFVCNGACFTGVSWVARLADALRARDAHAHLELAARHARSLALPIAIDLQEVHLPT